MALNSTGNERLKAIRCRVYLQPRQERPAVRLSDRQKIKEVSAVNDSTVKITLSEAYAPILHTFYSLKIINEKEVTSLGDKFGTVPSKAGTGPYFQPNTMSPPASNCKLLMDIGAARRTSRKSSIG